MGYKPERKTYDIGFPDYPDLQLIARGSSLGKLLDFGEININLRDQVKVREIFEFFSGRIITWNLEHPELDTNEEACALCGMAEGTPLPTTAQSMYCLDFTFVMQLFFGWMEAVARLSFPKAMNTQNGENVQEEWMKKLAELQSPLVSQEQS